MNQRSIVQSLLAWFARNARDLPWRRTSDPYAIWISEVMLQQTQVKTVLPYWKRWMRALPNLRALARAKPDRLHKLWEGLGYYTRVRNLHRAAQIIRTEHGGQIPAAYDDLLKLPGVGRYTAGAICSIAFNQPKPVLDGNVIRVLARLHGIAGNPRERKTNARLWRMVEDLVQAAARTQARPKASIPALQPEGRSGRGATPGACSCLNQSLMELGALNCTPREPRCGACPIAKYCVAYREDRVLELPQIGPSVPQRPRRFVAFVTAKRGRWLVRQRPAGVVNAHLWEFPNVELSPSDPDLAGAARRVLKVHINGLHPLCTIKHSITRNRITLEAYRVVSDDGARIPTSKGRWLDRKRLGQLAFTSAHRQILRRLRGR